MSSHFEQVVRYMIVKLWTLESRRRKGVDIHTDQHINTPKHKTGVIICGKQEEQMILRLNFVIPDMTRKQIICCSIFKNNHNSDSFLLFDLAVTLKFDQD